MTVQTQAAMAVQMQAASVVQMWAATAGQRMPTQPPEAREHRSDLKSAAFLASLPLCLLPAPGLLAPLPLSMGWRCSRS
jgi:hypothetical protein